MDSDGDGNRTDDSRDTSPDPITLPSSPLGNRSARKSREELRPTPRRQTRARTSRSKSVVMDTPQAGNASPWRIRVTVEAESRENTRSPSKRTRTVTIPLDDSRRSGSPVKRALSAMMRGEAEDGAAMPTPRVLKKRKGTPIRRGRSNRQKPPPEAEPVQEMEIDMAPEPSMDDNPMPPPPVPAPGARRSASRRSSGRIGILNAQSAPVLRSERLSMAREELDMALQDAVGDDPDQRFYGDAPGDATLFRNEDFSMISVETLQTTKDTSLSSILPTIPEHDRSTASISRTVASPPRARQSSHRAQNKSILNPGASSSLGERRATATKSPTPSSQLTPHPVVPRADPRSVPSSLREEVNRFDAEDLFDVGDDHNDNDTAPVHDEADLWQNEASRSLEDPVEPPPQQPAVLEADRSETLEDLFAHQPLRPARGKIPRTWRRSSGNDFSYVDSPAHAQQDLEDRRHSTDGSGVLTPPETEGESDDVVPQDYYMEQEHDPQSELTQPDAEATRYHVNDVDESDAQSSVHEDGEDEADDEAAENSVAGSDGNDGDRDVSKRSLQNGLPLMRDRPRRRPARKQTMDLTELLNLNGASSPAKANDKLAKSPAVDSSASRGVRASAIPSNNFFTETTNIRALNKSSAKGNRNLFGSSVLRSSDQSHGSADISQRPIHAPVFSTRAPQPRGRTHTEPEHEITDSFASKASDQQQLLQDMRRSNGTSRPLLKPRSSDSQRYHGPSRGFVRPDTRQPNEQTYESMNQSTGHEVSESADVTPSYQENLNHDSPQKIPVNFNDTSSLHSLKRSFSHAFGAVTEETTPKPAAPNPSLLSRVASTVWSAFVRPSGPTSIVAPNYQLPVNHQEQDSTFLDSDEDITIFNHDLRTHIRNRYGVVTSRFPWTMTHMRTLHRMLNSLTSGRPDSLIPNAGPLPPFLAQLINTIQITITDLEWLFTADHAYVVFSFLQVLVDDHVVEAMERGEVEWLGDKVSRSYRGYYNNDPRHGSENCFKISPKAEREGIIDWEFVVAALGCCVLSTELEEEELVQVANEG